MNFFQKMQTFISETLSKILQRHDSLEDVVIILPSQRAGVFVREACKHQIKVGFLPLIYSIEDFVAEISEFEKIDSIQLLFYFYEVYKSIEPEPQTFDLFSNWAQTALQDFNEVDQYLVDSKDLFTYVRDIKRLQKWSVEDQIQETEMMKTHYSFVEKLSKFYKALSELLISKKKGYQGLLYRQAINKIEEYLNKNSSPSFYFLGFNALTKSEEVLIQKVLQHPSSDIFWDIDTAFLNSNHQAGSFIRKYQKEWTFYEKNELQTVTSAFEKEKNIQVIGATKNVTQIKEIGHLLNSFDDFRETALVLGDESLLTIVLNSIPKKIPSINITMGYSLKDMPAFQFIKDYFNLYLSREKLNTKEGDFYHKTLFSFLNNSLLKKVYSKTDKESSKVILTTISKENMSFISVDFLTRQFKEPNIQNLFQKNMSVHNFVDQIIDFIGYAKDRVGDLEKEYLFRFYTAFVQLKNLNEEYNFFDELKMLYAFFKQVISKETISFQGEPLSGLQCMGVLETRVLDFKNVIISSMNEGTIPKNNQQNSFIPFDVKVHFGLPTYKEKDAIFSYHIFRLLQRAENIYLLYNTENDDYGNGEKSRFISQLDLMGKDIKFQTVSPRIPTGKTQPLEIQKTEAVISKLKERAAKGFSPSAISSYLYNPVEFYKQKILGLHEKEEVEETLAANTMGNIVHKALEELYSPFIDKYLTVDDILELEKKVVPKIDKLFPTYFKKGNYTTGKNKLMYEIVISYINRFLLQEKKLVESGKKLKILDLEKQIDAGFLVKDLGFPVRFYGEIDRIDTLDGVLRIVDYKTGVVEPKNMKIPEDWNLNDYQYSKAIQVLMYAYMFQKQTTKNYDLLQAGNISFKRLKSGFLPVTFSDSKETNQFITITKLQEFELSLGEILKEIFDVNVSFKEKEAK